MHPAQVPLEAEAEATEMDGPRHSGEGGRLLGDHLDVGVVGVDAGVELAQEVDGLEVLPAPDGVGQPLALLARVVEVDHGRHGVDPQAVGVVGGKPVLGRGGEEAAHLVAPVVEDEALPVRMEARAAGSACSYKWVPSKRPRAKSSAGKCEGTQSRMTPMPAQCRRSMSAMRSCGSP